MRKLALMLLTMFALSSLQASTKLAKIGEFKIDSLRHENSFLLDNGVVYKPNSHSQREASQDWQLGDNILILKAEHKNRFVLINSKTGERVRAKVVNRYPRVGNFDIVAFCKKKSFQLDDGNVYEPESSSARSAAKSWQIGNSILVLKPSHKNHYLLVNTTTGDFAKSKVIVTDSCH